MLNYSQSLTVNAYILHALSINLNELTNIRFKMILFRKMGIKATQQISTKR